MHSRSDFYSTSTTEAVLKNIRSAAVWGWCFTDPSDPTTWRPSDLRPVRLLVSRLETVYWACRDREKRLTSAHHEEAERRYQQRTVGDHQRAQLLGGRLLWYEPDMTVSDGMPEGETPFFDAHDCPPWETWVAWIPARSENPDDSAFLIAWVHSHLVNAVQCGINCSTTDCIGWLDERPCPIAESLRTAGYLS